MKRLFSRVPKKLLVLSLVAGAILGTTAIARAWWPERPTFTVAHPAPYVTFNSITDNPNYGDERTFFDAKDAANTQVGGYTDKTKVHDGQTIVLRTYVHNNAGSNLNDAAHGFKGVAQNAKVQIYVPTATATVLRANSYVSASNATPAQVSDTTDLYGDQPFSLEYVQNSATTYNNAHPNGIALSNDIVKGGALLGYDTMNGVIPGCFQYDNIVSIEVKVHMQNPGYKVTKQVALPGGQWSKDVTAKPGDTVSYLLGFNNTGNTTLTNVGLQDKLPKHMTIVPGTTTITNANNPKGVSAGTDDLVKNGINIGGYNPASNAYVSFKAKVDNEDQLECGMNKLTNTVEAFQGNNPTVSDTAVVYVNRTCVNPKPFFECTLLDVKQSADRKVDATVTYKAENGAKFKIVSYDFGDNTSPLVTDKTAVSHTYAADGNYLIRATITFTANGKDQTATSESCAKSVSFTSGQPNQPGQLPNTGAGDVIGMFAAVAVAAAVAYRFILARRYS